MSNYIRGIVWQLTLPPTAKYVAIRLAEYADDSGGSVYPSVDRVARETNLHERTVRRALNELKRRRVIIIEAPHGPHRATRYRFPVTAKTTVSAQVGTKSGLSPQRTEPKRAESHATPDPVSISPGHTIHRSVSDHSIDPSSSTRARADDHDDGVEKGATAYDAAVKAVTRLLQRPPGGSIRASIAAGLAHGVPLDWFVEVCGSSEAEGARAPWPYAHAVLDHWRRDGYRCDCKRPAGVEA